LPGSSGKWGYAPERIVDLTDMPCPTIKSGRAFFLPHT
jgi:hypothetical protein